jgi:hypothetical protein
LSIFSSVRRALDPDRRHWRWRPSGRVIIAFFTAVATGLALFVLAASSAPGPEARPARPVGSAPPPAQARTARPAGPAAPPARVCGNKSLLGGGPAAKPAGAVAVAPGDDSGVNFGLPHTTYWFAPGVHTLGPGLYAQVIPGSGSTYIGAPGAVLDGKHTNLYAFGGSATGVTIRYLTIQDFGPNGGNQNAGVVNHDSAAGWTIDHSTVSSNAGAGVMLGTGNTLESDCLKNNQQYGFSAYSPAGPASLVLTHNEIVGNDSYNWESHVPGCGCSGGGKFWDVNGAVITGNWVHGNHNAGLWADTDNRSFDIERNLIEDNYASGLIYEISYNALIKDNTFNRNGLGAGPTTPGFPTGAIYLSESGSDKRVPGKYGSTFTVTGNTFTNNWGGVILWENADRFCGSPANTSGDTCTLVNPSRVTERTCNAGNIDHEPYYGDCRWKTQNVAVSRNVFNFSPVLIGPSCTVSALCGFQGVFSQYGTFPSWSPYRGVTVEDHITFSQHNRFFSNAYHGPWQFMIHEQGNVVSWGTWRSSPFSQDAGSTFTG